MLYLKQATATQSVLIGPFVDDTDGATAETALTIANTDIRLSANGGNMFAKTSGGGTHDENGWYAITLDATDTATVGRLQLSCKVAGALAVFAEFQVLEETVYDALFAASAAGELAVKLSTQGKADVAAELATYDAPTNAEMEARTLAAAAYFDPAADTVTVGTNNDKTGYSLTAGPLDAAGIRSAVGLAAANLDTQLADIPTVAELGAEIDAVEAAIAALDDLSAAAVNAQVAAALATYDPPTKAELDAGLAALNDISAAEVNAEVVDVIRTDTIPDSYATDGAQPTIAQAILAIQQFLQERSVSGTTVTVKKPDGSTSAMTFTLDDGSAPTSISRAT